MSLRVLVVDDLVDFATTLRLLLSTWGHVVHSVHSGTEALAVAGEFRPDVVLLDLGMPVMDGYEAARRLREIPGLEDAVLVAVSGYAQDEDRRRSLRAGFGQHLAKPVDLGELAALLTRLKPDEVQADARRTPWT